MLSWVAVDEQLVRCAHRRRSATSGTWSAIVFLDLFPGQDARYVEASWARVCALLGDEIGNQTDAGWQTTIDPLYPGGELPGRGRRPGRRPRYGQRDPLPAPVDRGGPRAPAPASDNLRRVRTWPSRGRTARPPRRTAITSLRRIPLRSRGRRRAGGPWTNPELQRPPRRRRMASTP